MTVGAPPLGCGGGCCPASKVRAQTAPAVVAKS
jgi:hypothetical protein